MVRLAQRQYLKNLISLVLPGFFGKSGLSVSHVPEKPGYTVYIIQCIHVSLQNFLTPNRF